MNEFIDIYCERLGPGLWAEPLNAVSNAAFFIAALFAALLMRRTGAGHIGVWLLLLLLLAIGTGSTLFHTFATRWASLADTIPILLYQIVFLLTYSRLVIGLDRWRCAALLGFFIAAVIGFGMLPQDWLNGSIAYIPALLFMAGLGLYHAVRHKPARYWLIGGAGVFCISLTFRSVDMAVCDVLPIGVHYMWHMLNGLVLYMAFHALVRGYKDGEYRIGAN